MADLIFTVELDDKGTPVIKNIRRAADDMGSGAERASKRAESGFASWQAKIITVNQALQLTTSIVRGVSRITSALVDIFQDLTAAASAQEDAEAKRNAALRSTGQLTKEYVDELNAQAAAFQKVTTFGDETVIGLQQQLIAFGASRDQMKSLTQNTLDLAAGMRVDLSSAALLMGKAIAGEFSTLSRYGIFVDEAASKSEKLAQAQQQIAQRFGGQARAAAETYSGAVKQLGNAWSDLKEELGLAIGQNRSVISVIDLVKEQIADFTDFVRENKGEIQLWISDALIVALETLLVFNQALGFTISTLESTARRVQGLRSGDLSVFFKTNAELAKDTEEKFFALDAAIGRLIGVAQRLRGQSTGAIDEFFLRTKKGLDESDPKIKQFEKSLASMRDSLHEQIIRFTEGEEGLQRYKIETLQTQAAQLGMTATSRRLLDEIITLTQGIRTLTEEQERQKALGQVIDDLRQRAVERERVQQGVRDKIADIEKEITQQFMTDSQRRVAAIQDEAEQRIQLIDDALARGIINEERAGDLRGRIAESAMQKLKDAAEDTSEFMRRAFERGFDAISDALTDLLDNGASNFEDFAEKIRKTINRLVADQLTLQLRDLLAGKGFGAPGVPLGGLAGQAGGFLDRLLGREKITVPAFEPSEKFGGMTPTDFLDQEFGQLLSGGSAAITATSSAAQAAIQATASTAQATTQAAIQSAATTATTALQAELSAGQAAINSTQFIAEASIKSVEAVAISAIQAASAGKAAGGAGGFLGLFGGGGGGAPDFDLDFFEGFRKGGIVGVSEAEKRLVDPRVFAHAPRYQTGGVIGLGPDEVPIIAHRGERVLSVEETRDLDRGRAKRSINVTMVINTPDAASFKRSEGEIRGQAARMIRHATLRDT